MTLIVRTCVDWLGRRQTWADVLVLSAVVGGGVLLAGHGPGPTPARAVGATFLALGAALALRRSLTTFVGPMLGYELVRSTRRNAPIVNRCFYLVSLGLVLYLVYVSWFPDFRRPSQLFARFVMEREKVPKFAESFFVSFFVLQYLTVLFVTPAYVSGTIPAERANGTLDHLLTTSLTSREIVLGILVARLSNLMLLLIAGLPVLGMLQFLGGIDPNLVLASFVMVFVTMLSLGAVSTLIAVHARTPLGGMLFTYLWTILYLYFAPAFVQLTYIDHEASVLWVGLGVYSVIHLVVVGFCLPRAVRNLRPATSGSRAVAPRLPSPARPAAGPPPRPARAVPKRGSADDATSDRDEPLMLAPVAATSPLPPVLDDALRWKEVFVEQRVNQDVQMILMVFGVGYFLFTYLIAIVGVLLMEEVRFDVYSNMLARVFGTLYVGCLLPCFAFSAAYRVTRERERQTLDSLLTTPYEAAAILGVKWWSSIYAFRRMMPTLAAIWLLALLTRGVSPPSLLLLALAAAIYAALAASLGLWFSVRCRTTFRAVLYVALAGPPLLAGPGLPWRLISATPLAGDGSDWLELFLDQGLSPVVNLWTLCFGWSGIAPVRLLAGVAGLACHGLLAAFLWYAAKIRFEGLKGPPARRRPTL